jgi:hypothetical protein
VLSTLNLATHLEHATGVALNLSPPGFFVIQREYSSRSNVLTKGRLENLAERTAGPFYDFFVIGEATLNKPTTPSENEQERLRAFKERARKLGYEIEPAFRRPGYCLWEVLPGIGRHMILGRDGDITLTAIAQKLAEIEAASSRAPKSIAAAIFAAMELLS